MCGIIAIAGRRTEQVELAKALETLRHRGPDAGDMWFDDNIALGHARLKIIDLSDAGRQPMTSADGRYVMTFNGEAYNYLELRAELSDYPFRSTSDSEVVLAAWARWGRACLDKIIGMFAFVVWDRSEKTLTAVRDRFGVKPLEYRILKDGIAIASEIKALHALGAPREEDPVAWSSYLASGTHDHSARTFWRGISSLPAGCCLTWRAGHDIVVTRWYDLAERVGQDYDTRSVAIVKEEYLALLEHAVRLRFRSDVPVGVSLSGGVDSSTLLALVQRLQGPDSAVKVFSFATGDATYDELPWVEAMLAQTCHPLVPCLLRAEDVPERAERMMRGADEPYGGVPTLAYSTVFEHARAAGVIVVLDGQGMDEQWAGYDYYTSTADVVPNVQGGVDPAIRPDCLSPEFREIAEHSATLAPFHDRLRNLQLRDSVQTKIPRSLRYTDRISMAASVELREPFLDHRLFELAMRQPPERKIHEGTHKYLLRELIAPLVPKHVSTAPKRAVQTPQREWLRGPLRAWANELIESALRARPEWFDAPAARTAWRQFCEGHGDHSNWVWQWLSVGLARSIG